MTDYDDGDWRIATLTVSPFDGTTSAVLTVISPAGATTTPAVTSSGGGATWTAAGYAVTAGEWIERWVITGTGKGKQRTTVSVAPDPAGVPVGSRLYATSADYAEELLEAPPTGIRRKLLTASRMVDQMLLTAIYDTDDDGMPTDDDMIAAMKLATVLQVEFAAGAGDSKMVGAPAASNFSLGKLAVTRNQSAGGGLGGVGPRGEWSPRAWDALQAAGLTGHAPGDSSGWSWE